MTDERLLDVQEFIICNCKTSADIVYEMQVVAVDVADGFVVSSSDSFSFAAPLGPESCP